VSIDLLVTGIGHLTTNSGPPVKDAVVAVGDGRVVYAGDAAGAPGQDGAARMDVEGRAVIPGFVDAHTHIVFAGDRSEEFAMKMSGAGYREIAAAGGGILSTVRATREASADQLLESATDRVSRMIASGTTTLEIKSGYGLDEPTEATLLEVARRLSTTLPVTIKTTFLGAHAVPPELRDDRGRYVDQVISMLPRMTPLADYCDVFVEDGAFTVEEGREILTAAAAAGLRARVHAEQLSHSGGAALAAELAAVSADHLDHATPEDARMLATAGVTAVLVPGASYAMRGAQAPGPMLIEEGCVVALATDCNPGTSYFEGMGLVISLAVVDMGLTPEQAVWSATKGGAIALELPDHGSLGRGDVADMVVLDAPTPAHIAYRPATNLAWATIRRGMVAYQVPRHHGR
jgi:imidazolonepropionase